MRVLIVGNADSIYIKSLVEQTLVRYNDEVCILSPVNSIYKGSYKRDHVRVIREDIRPGKLNTILSGLRNRKAFAQRYDLVCFHYIDMIALMMIPVAKHFSKGLVFSYWGSDLLRHFRSKHRIAGKLLLRFVDAATFCSPSLLERYQKEYGAVKGPKTYLLDFGQDIVDKMSCMVYDEHLIREKYGIDDDSVVVTVGYNRGPAQQHLKVLEQIALLPEETRKKMHLLLRLTYGSCGDGYLEEVKRQTALTGCSFTFLESYLTDDQVAEITRMTDVFIHAQTTDAQSGTVSEHLYAGCLVLNPEWLRYKGLEGSCFYLSYKDFDELRTMLAENIFKKDDSPYRDRLQHNQEVIHRLSSWEFVAPKWRKLYREILSEK